MKTFIYLIIGIFFCQLQAQNATIKGQILNAEKEAIEGVSVLFLNQKAQTDKQGFYQIQIPSNRNVTVIFSHIAYKKTTAVFKLQANEIKVFDFVLNQKQEQMGTVVITGNNKKRIKGIQMIDSDVVKHISGANAGVEQVLKTLPGVNSNNELSSQYAVRGGNYDENLVYVNEIEVYRPFLIRSGQQEGLSFTNTSMIQNIDFSAGGFQAKFGDKLSSVLDITYRKPSKFQTQIEASLLGGSITTEGLSKNKKWSAIAGVRYRNNQLLVKSQDTETNFKPSFLDTQILLNYQSNEKWNFSFLGNVSQNNYQYQPLTRQTNFGTLDSPKALVVYYDGNEQDNYKTFFGAFKTVFKPNNQNSYKLISSVYQTNEQEYYDILAQYRMGEVETDLASGNLGNVKYTRAIGSQLSHARNNLQALIANVEWKAQHEWGDHQIDWGLKYTKEKIKDRLIEWEVIDSAGFSLNPIKLLPKKDEPYFVYNGPLAPYQNIRAYNEQDIQRFSAFVQWNFKGTWGNHEIFSNIGIRSQSWNISSIKHHIFSPRFLFGIKPNWEKDMVFSLAFGLYQQPPFYRELRDANGVVNPNTLAQKSFNVVLSNDYNFRIWERPFKLISEVYYKNQTDVNVYTLDNVRIRYAANNDATAYAYGLDLRMNGEFIPGTESWVSFGYLKTQENQENKGFIDRPTDQRLKFALMVQDYMPKIPSMKIYLNLVYNTGLPGGSPVYADPYLYQNRLRDYKRADVGFFKIFKDNNEIDSSKKWLKSFEELALGFEIFNIFNNQNAITNTWVRDVYSKSQFAIPNYMTTRVFNIKLNLTF